MFAFSKNLEEEISPPPLCVFGHAKIFYLDATTAFVAGGFRILLTVRPFLESLAASENEDNFNKRPFFEILDNVLIFFLS